MHTIGVFFGSRSPEHDISIITGQLIISELNKLGKNVVAIYLDKEGHWLIGQEVSSLKTFISNVTLPHNLQEYYLDLEKSHGKMVFKKKGIIGQEINIDLAFPAFHGKYGEDGTIQGMFEMLDIPYVGCDVTSLSLTIDKVLTKLLYQAQGIPTTKFIFFHKNDWNNDKNKWINKAKENLQWPVIVKPATLGSSIGIAKANDEKELEFAIEVAFHYDTKALVEECVDNLSDITCALLGNNDPTPSLLQESVFEKDFLSYEDKYLKEDGTQLGEASKNLFIPARLDQRTTQEIQEMAVNIFKIFGCSGTARVDFLYDKKLKKFYANEINPLPGTLYHHLWQKSGMDISEVLKRLINLAQEKYEEKKSINYSFKSDLLKFANSVKLQLKNNEK
ncbi:MAG: D-alanine--D-alanine ligase [Candidatus Roizmanbacteria bacterium]|nr:MAG: D-alanine--D-alanine ligase [Candidatus Roizmanbacteria bacterium]